MLNKQELKDLLDPALRLKLRNFTREVLYEATALVCFNDEIAYSLLPILTKFHINVPEDLSIVSFDDSYLSMIEQIRITSLAHEKHSFTDAVTASLTRLLSDTSTDTIAVPWILSEGTSIRESD
jgi:GntR family transcriptional regulator of arabinose operon